MVLKPHSFAGLTVVDRDLVPYRRQQVHVAFRAFHYSLRFANFLTRGKRYGFITLYDIVPTLKRTDDRPSAPERRKVLSASKVESASVKASPNGYKGSKPLIGRPLLRIVYRSQASVRATRLTATPALRDNCGN
jgi:hypothetical protein